MAGVVYEAVDWAVARDRLDMVIPTGRTATEMESAAAALITPAVKSAMMDAIRDANVLADGCPVEFILADAAHEGEARVPRPAVSFLAVDGARADVLTRLNTRLGWTDAGISGVYRSGAGGYEKLVAFIPPSMTGAAS